MRIKLDENIPASLVSRPTALGHDTDTVSQEGLQGHDDKHLWEESQRAGRFLVTQDLDFSDARQFSPSAHHGVMVVRLVDPSRRRLIERFARVFETEAVTGWNGCLVVVTDRKIRVRRPD